MLVKLKATPAGEELIKFGKTNVLQYWDNGKALDLLEAIINNETVQESSPQDLYDLLDRGFIEIEQA